MASLQTLILRLLIRMVVPRGQWFATSSCRTTGSKEFTHVNLGFTDSYYLSANGGNLNFSNNLFTSPDNGGALTGESVRFISGSNGVAPINITHNTVLNGYPFNYNANVVIWNSNGATWYPEPTGVIFRDNNVGFGNYGFFCGDPGGVMSTCWPSYAEDHNLFALNVNPPNTSLSSQFPNATDRVAASWAAALFVGTCDKSNVITNCALQSRFTGSQFSE